MKGIKTRWDTITSPLQHLLSMFNIYTHTYTYSIYLDQILGNISGCECTCKIPILYYKIKEIRKSLSYEIKR